MTDLSGISTEDLMKAAGVQAPPPDLSGMSNEDLMSAMKAAPPMSTARDVARSVGTGLVEGGAGLAGMPSDLWHLIDRGYQNALGWGLTKLGALTPEQAAGMTKPIPEAGEQYNYGSANIAKTVGDAAGGLHAPQTTAGQYADTVSSFLPGAVAFGAKSFADVPGALVKYGVLPGVGSEAGGQLTAGTPYEPYARFAGGVLGSTAGSIPVSAATKVVNAARGVSNPVLDAYKDLGVDPVLAGDVTGNPTLQGAQAFATKAPFSAGRMEAAGQNAVDQFGNAIETTAAGLGKSQTLQQAGQAVQLAGQGWLNNFKTQGKALWNKVGMYVPESDRVSIGNYDAALDAIGKTLPDAQATAKTLQPALSRNLFDALQQDAGSSGTLSWQSVKGIRSRLGEMLSDPQIVADTGTAELKRLYGALTQDMKTHLQGIDNTTAAIGGTPGAVDAFNAASTFTKNGHELLDSGLGQILKKGTTPEQAAQTALSGTGNGGSFIQMLRDQLPKAADEVAAYKLRDMSLATAGKQGATGNAVSPGTFLTDLNKLSPEARSALFADPAVASKVNSAAIVADTMKKTAAKLNTSNTGPYESWKAIAALPEAIGGGALAGNEIAGLPGAITGGIMGAGAPFSGVPFGYLTSSGPLTRMMATPGMSLASAKTAAAASALGPLRRLLGP